MVQCSRRLVAVGVTGTWCSARSVRFRGGTDFEFLSTHAYRKTVATLLDESGMTARQIADQLGHSRVSMTQDKCLGRGAVNTGNVRALEAVNPDCDSTSESPEIGQIDEGKETGTEPHSLRTGLRGLEMQETPDRLCWSGALFGTPCRT
ncbi:tyrosine-type recombinase/integrase [Nocardioides sp. NPDC101246]|uniref:tyrosine-type recombinase/integrase n=1 Tax=Nocardioides sp. NPDC101246 TaxID=3364336 RepID=UPI0037F9434D